MILTLYTKTRKKLNMRMHYQDILPDTNIEREIEPGSNDIQREQE